MCTERVGSRLVILSQWGLLRLQGCRSSRHHQSSRQLQLCTLLSLWQSPIKNLIIRLRDKLEWYLLIYKFRYSHEGKTCVAWCAWVLSWCDVMWLLQEELAARVAKQQAAVMAAGLLDKESEESSSVIGPSMPEPEPPHIEVTVGVSAHLKSLYNPVLLNVVKTVSVPPSLSYQLTSESKRRNIKKDEGNERRIKTLIIITLCSNLPLKTSFPNT